MLNIDNVDKVYLACGVTDLRRNIDGLTLIIQTQLKLNPFEKALFVFCNKQMNKLKILHFDDGFWLYYYRLERSRFKWLMTTQETLKINGESNIISTKAPNTLLHKSMASNELLSHVINLKYQYALPLYRQETYFDMLGVSLSRQTLSNWIIGAAKEFQSIYDLMKEKLLESHYIQAD